MVEGIPLSLLVGLCLSPYFRYTLLWTALLRSIFPLSLNRFSFRLCCHEFSPGKCLHKGHRWCLAMRAEDKDVCSLGRVDVVYAMVVWVRRSSTEGIVYGGVAWLAGIVMWSSPKPWSSSSSESVAVFKLWSRIGSLTSLVVSIRHNRIVNEIDPAGAAPSHSPSRVRSSEFRVRCWHLSRHVWMCCVETCVLIFRCWDDLSASLGPLFVLTLSVWMCIEVLIFSSIRQCQSACEGGNHVCKPYIQYWTVVNPNFVSGFPSC